jgi:hypothetical protein
VIAMPTCAYPGCRAAAAGSRFLFAQPEPIDLVLCANHLAVVDHNRRAPETRDFWRWFHAMSGMNG